MSDAGPTSSQYPVSESAEQQDKMDNQSAIEESSRTVVDYYTEQSDELRDLPKTITSEEKKVQEMTDLRNQI